MCYLFVYIYGKNLIKRNVRAVHVRLGKTLIRRAHENGIKHMSSLGGWNLCNIKYIYSIRHWFVASIPRLTGARLIVHTRIFACIRHLIWRRIYKTRCMDSGKYRFSAILCLDGQTQPLILIIAI